MTDGTGSMRQTDESLDLEGLRVVEGRMRDLAQMVRQDLGRVVDDWGFLIFAVEFEGCGSCYVTSSATREQMIERARYQGRRMIGKGRASRQEVRFTDHPAAIAPRKVERLLAMLKLATGRIAHSMPEGWGCALLLYPVAESEQVLYCSNCDSETMGLALLESAEIWEQGGDRPPGVLGREN